MSKIKKVVNILIFICIISLILFLNIGTIDIVMNGKNYLPFSKGLALFGIILFILYIIYKIFNKEKIKLKDIIMLLLISFGIISYKYAIDKEIALYGAFGRNEGLLVIITYYMTYLASSTIEKKYQKIIMHVLLFTGVIQVFIGSFQFFRVDNVFGYDRSNKFSTRFKLASGSFGNPNFYSTYILMCLLYCYGILLKHKDKIIKLIYLLLTIYFLYGLIIGDTLSCILSFIIILFATTIVRVNKKNIKKVLLITLSVILCFVLSVKVLDNIFTYNIEKRIKKNINEISLIFKEGINDSSGNGRIYVWKESLRLTSENMLNGIGIDNLGVSNNGEYIIYKNNDEIHLFDKVHNEYLQKLVTEGIFSFITYICLLVYIIFRYIKSEKDIHKYSLFIVYIGYLIQAIFNISVIPVAPVFYIIMGFITSDDVVTQ